MLASGESGDDAIADGERVEFDGGFTLRAIALGGRKEEGARAGNIEGSGNPIPEAGFCTTKASRIRSISSGDRARKCVSWPIAESHFSFWRNFLRMSLESRSLRKTSNCGTRSVR